MLLNYRIITNKKYEHNDYILNNDSKGDISSKTNTWLISNIDF